MDTLESPVEALALNYFSYNFLTAINGVWAAWIAVITAAISFWRIRVLSSPPVPRCLSPEAASTSKSKQPPKNVVAAAAEVVKTAPVSSPADEMMKNLSTSSTPKATSCSVLEREGSAKMKFTVHYNEDDFREQDDDDDDEPCEDDNHRCCGGDRVSAVADDKLRRWCDDWEKTMMVRMGDMGWYRFQDLMVLDGSVVRLWEGRRRRRQAAAVGRALW